MKRIIFSLMLISSFAEAREVCFPIPFGSRHCVNIPDAPPAKECAVLYQHGGFGGAAWGIRAETESPDVSGAMIERRTWRGHMRGYSGTDRSWNDATSSIRVTPGCVLDTWVDTGFSGQNLRYDGISEGQVALNDSLSSFKCTCKETKITNQDGTILYFSAPLP